MNDTSYYQLLAQCQEFAPEFAGGMSLHLPMALTALHKMGAVDARLTDFYTQQSTKLAHYLPSEQIIEQDQWRDFLGQTQYYASYRDFFLEQIRRHGYSSCLRQFLPHLLPGIASAAFHALIRLAYALEIPTPEMGGEESAEACIKQEVAAALASFASQFQALGHVCATNSANALAPSQIRRLLEQLLAPPLQTWSCESDLISAQIATVAALPAFESVSTWLANDELTLQYLSSCAAHIYLQESNFTVLHMLTASHAMRLVLPYFSDQSLALRGFWQAYAAAFIASGVRYIPQAEPAIGPLPDWQQIFNLAMASDNEHVIKLVYSCCEEYQAYRLPVYWQVAAKACV